MEHGYLYRNATLRSLGFASYADYLASDLWKGVKERAILEHGTKCRLCQNPYKSFHHLGYGKKVLLGESLRQLIPLCGRCHHKIEFDGDGTKRTVVEAHGRYVQLWKRAKGSLPPTPENLRFLRRCGQCGNRLRKRGGPCRSCGNV